MMTHTLEKKPLFQHLFPRELTVTKSAFRDDAGKKTYSGNRDPILPTKKCNRGFSLKIDR
jgi:hypothetical protein